MEPVIRLHVQISLSPFIRAITLVAGLFFNLFLTHCVIIQNYYQAVSFINAFPQSKLYSSNLLHYQH